MTEAVQAEGGPKLAFKDLDDGVLHLPGGYVDEQGNLHATLQLRELTGEEEDILADAKMPGYQKIDKVLSNCTTALGALTDKTAIKNAVPKLTIGDRVVALLALRIVSLGSNYDFSSQCPACNEKNAHKLDLSELAVEPMKDPKQRQYELPLPSGKKAVVKVMTGEDEAKIHRLGKAKQGFGREQKSVGKDPLTLNLIARLVSIDGHMANVDNVKKLGLKDRNAIRNWYLKAEGGVDTDLELKCDSCGLEYESVLDVGQPSFFFPKESEE